jgi:predicted dehydrogenase
MAKIKTGIIGAGHLGKMHLKNIKEISDENNDIALAGIFDIDKEKNKAVSHEYALEKNNSYEELLEKINTLVIVTPTSTHFEIASAAFGKDINTFIEKPVTDSVESAKELIKISEGKKIKIQVGHIERFNPALLSLEKYQLAPFFIESHRLAQFNPRGTDVSVIQDLMIHDIDVILNLVKSKVKSINANGVGILTDKIDIANARIQFENGCVANITASRISQKKMRKMRIFQKYSYISIDFLQNSAEVFKLVKENETASGFAVSSFKQGEEDVKIIYEQPEIKNINSLKYELNKFFDCIINDYEPVVTLSDGLEALEVANEIIKEISNSQQIISHV